ncbi:MAG: Ppx/GppA phosphatase family protein [Bdellovibrionales bacterium]
MDDKIIEKPRVAALDLGSNSFLLTVAEIVADGFEVLHDECVITRLGQGVDSSGRLHPEALKRAEESFKNFSQTMQSFGVQKIKAMATSAARDAKNGDAFIGIGRKYGIPIEIITGDREAELTFKGGLVHLDTVGSPLIVDIGGGSTEFITEINNEIVGRSLDIGSIRLTEKFISNHPVHEDELVAMASYVRGQLESLPEKFRVESSMIVAVAGTPTTLASLIEATDFDVNKMHGKRVQLKDLEHWLITLKEMSVKKRLALKGMQEGRADVIVAGLCILDEAIRFFHMDEFTVSCTGVRYGLLKELAQEIYEIV